MLWGMGVVLMMGGLLRAQDIAGTWQGTLEAGKSLRTVVKIAKADAGWKGNLYSIDQVGHPLALSKISAQGGTVKFSVIAVGGEYTATLSGDGGTMNGSMPQGPNPLPLVLTKVKPETAWAIPEPPKRLPPMAADANPSFEVATIKPTKPDQPGKYFSVRGNRFSTYNTTLADMLSFAYGIHAKQIVGAPAWVDSDKFDIAAQPDTEGAPSDSGLPGNFFRGLGQMTNVNSTLVDFARTMQGAVLDRPVIDQTGITGASTSP